MGAAGNLGGVLIGRVLDRFRHHKSILGALLSLCCLFLVYFALLIMQVIPPSVIQIFVAATAVGLFLNTAVPIFFELSIEATYPVPEATVCTVMTTMNNFGSLVMLFIPVTQAATAFNFVFAATVGVLALAVIFVYQNKGKRQLVDDIDEGLLEDGGDKQTDVYLSLNAGGAKVVHEYH